MVNFPKARYFVLPLYFRDGEHGNIFIASKISLRSNSLWIVIGKFHIDEDQDLRKNNHFLIKPRLRMQHPSRPLEWTWVQKVNKKKIFTRNTDFFKKNLVWPLYDMWKLSCQTNTVVLLLEPSSRKAGALGDKIFSKQVSQAFWITYSLMKSTISNSLKVSHCIHLVDQHFLYPQSFKKGKMMPQKSFSYRCLCCCWCAHYSSGFIIQGSTLFFL